MNITQYHQEEINAKLFIQALKVDVKLKNIWIDLIKKINNLDMDERKYQQSLNAIDNFLSDNGFDCAATDILSLLKTPFYTKHQDRIKANQDSDRFVQTMLADVKLYQGWQKALSQSVKDGLDVADNFLKNNGYDCNSLQVDSSFRKMRAHNLAYWAGVYLTKFEDDSGKSIDGPVIVISEHSKVSVNQDQLNKHLNKITFKDGCLTWKAAHIGIKYSGVINFGEKITKHKDDDIGNYLFGSIEYPKGGDFSHQNYVGKLSIAGVIGTLQDNSRIALDNIPAHISLPKMNQIIKYMSYILVGLFMIKMAYSVGVTVKGVAGKLKGKLFDRFSKNEETLSESEVVTRSPFKNSDIGEQSTMLSDLKMRQDEAYSEAEAQEVKMEFNEQFKSEENFDTLAEEESIGKGWLDELGVIVKSTI
ncbi:MAG: hypothetical protein PSN36_01910 [Gammaproteobacteria bacterium]|nr:hypothetical protein [Gammaproteobacteria bacterium]